jgi:hypothetical protein
MATVRSADLSQEAEIASKLGLVEAMNLDGGTSSGLYYDGKYLLILTALPRPLGIHDSHESGYPKVHLS